MDAGKLQSAFETALKPRAPPVSMSPLLSWQSGIPLAALNAHRPIDFLKIKEQPLRHCLRFPYALTIGWKAIC